MGRSPYTMELQQFNSLLNVKIQPKAGDSIFQLINMERWRSYTSTVCSLPLNLTLLKLFFNNYQIYNIFEHTRYMGFGNCYYPIPHIFTLRHKMGKCNATTK